MARRDRTGERKSRSNKQNMRVPELGYYLIATDTKGTERCFFCGLQSSLPDEIKNRIVIKVVETRTNSLIDKCVEYCSYDAQYRSPWIVFDRDEVHGFDDIIMEAEKKGIRVGWSNPCFEIWMYAYFGKMPVIQESWNCCSEFGRIFEAKTGQKYTKVDDQIYSRLCEKGNEETAIRIARQKLDQCIRDGKIKPSEMCPATTVHELVEEIKGKLTKNTEKCDL